MILAEFLTLLNKPQSLQPGIVCFMHKNYPALFFSQVHRFVRVTQTIQTVDAAITSFTDIQTQCSMSFLGSQYIIWLGNLSDLDTKKQQQLLQFCATYTGPHTLWFFISEPELWNTAHGQTITLPESITLQEYQELCTAWYPSIARTAQSLKDIFIQGTVDLEFAVLLLQYHCVLGRQVDMFVDQWAPKLREPEQSLFTLTTHFFAKQATPFFRLWKTIEPEYPAVFWSTFWSEQLFRAACVVECMRTNNPVLAKKMSYRLPFSFIQKDYKKVTLKELQRAHQFMYDYDVHVKNSGTPEFLDVMFGTFFTGCSSRY